jgi:nitroimidazol reductase NimA-like FMN-containing flavoprotein (pyridoxamine 5'-phosphate oxidase superfamily)
MAPDERYLTTPLSAVRRVPELARDEREVVQAVFDAAPAVHVGFVVEGRPVVLPTLCHREGDTLLLHGSRSNRMLRAMCGPAGACVTATLYDGLILARSWFNHSVAYRSATAFGHPTPVTDEEEKVAALGRLVDHVLPGRRDEARPPDDRELALTALVRMDIEEATAKVSTGPPEDFEPDLARPVWAGVVPAGLTWGEPVPDRAGTPPADPGLPRSVRRLLGR